MKRIRCPKCNEAVTFDETRYEPGRTLVFDCPSCHKQFKIRIPEKREEKVEEETGPAIQGYLIVVENAFHYKQEIPLYPGRNVVGRYVKGTKANAAITTTDPSIDTTHCIITVHPDKQGRMRFTLQDAPSNTGTFLMNQILGDRERADIEDGSIVTIGATTLILRTNTDNAKD